MLRITARPWERRLFLVFALAFTAVQLGLAVIPMLPGQQDMKMAWPMFVGAHKSDRWLTFRGTEASGEVILIDVTRFLRYTRGFTDQRVTDIHKGLWRDSPRHQRHQRVFARWLARQVWLADGVALTEVHFQRHRRRIKTGQTCDGAERIITIEAVDLERDIPRESGADR